MHNKNTGDRDNRSPNQNSTGSRGFGSGLRKVRDGAKLSNAVGYGSKQAPRIRRIIDKS